MLEAIHNIEGSGLNVNVKFVTADQAAMNQLMFKVCKTKDESKLKYRYVKSIQSNQILYNKYISFNENKELLVPVLCPWQYPTTTMGNKPLVTILLLTLQPCLVVV